MSAWDVNVDQPRVKNRKFYCRAPLQCPAVQGKLWVMTGGVDALLPHIVVVGAGFGGLTFARRFPQTNLRGQASA